MGQFDRLSGDARGRGCGRRHHRTGWRRCWPLSPTGTSPTRRGSSSASWTGNGAWPSGEDGEVRLLSRSQQRLNNTYPEIVESGLARYGAHRPRVQVRACPGTASPGTGSIPQRYREPGPDGHRRRRGSGGVRGGRTSFERLQQRLGITDRKRRGAARWLSSITSSTLLYLDGYDTTALGLRDRKTLLRRSAAVPGRLAFHTASKRSGEEYFQFACAHGWEGLVAKRAGSTYVSRRSPDWLKFKCSLGQEFVVGGYTEPAGGRVGLGALLVGYYDGGQLVYAGKVGTGFSTATLLSLRRQLDALRTDKPTFTRGRITERGVHWVRPELVAEVVFSEWTTDGKLRHPRFEGLRTDKAASDVQRERPVGQRQAWPGA